MHRINLLATLAVSLASPAGAQTQYASFDGSAEGIVGNTYVEDGLVFDDIDSYLSSGTILPFAIEAASATFGGIPGFGPPNVLKFGTPTPGLAVSGLGRFGSFTITPPGPRQSAVVNLIMLGGLFGSNVITLEGSLGGAVVVTDSLQIPQGNWVPGVLAVSGVTFDQLRVFSSGSADQGASFVAFDSIVVEETGPGSTYCTNAPTSLGAGAQISATGSKSVHANNMVLHAAPVPNQPGIFFYGPSQIQLPFGDGFQCVGGTVNRLDVHFATNNALSHALDVTQPPSIASTIFAGSTWNFQAWFRDPGAGGSGFNLSDGLEVSFTP